MRAVFPNERLNAQGTFPMRRTDHPLLDAILS